MEPRAREYGFTAVQYRTLERFVRLHAGRDLTGKLRWDGDIPDYRERRNPDWLEPKALFVMESRRILVHAWEEQSLRARRLLRRRGAPVKGWYRLTAHGREVAVALGLASEADVHSSAAGERPSAGGAGTMRFNERVYRVARDRQ